MAKLIFSNIIGWWVFDEYSKLIEGMPFKDIDQKKEFENKLRQKHGNLTVPKGKELYNILYFFKDKKYFSKFHEENLGITKNSIKDSVRDDILISQTISALEEIDRTINLLAKRLREWYSLYNPEIGSSIADNEKFVSVILRKSKNEILNDLNVKDSMGAELDKKDISVILLLATQLNNFFKLKVYYESYLKELENQTCPNFAMVGGLTIAAKLINHAGSMKRLTEMPASTLQILGAEKALFRHMRNKRRNLPPKYGIIHEHQLIQKSNSSMHGKAARALADKLSIAVKIDYFKGKFIGDKLKKELIDKFKIQY